MKIAQLETWVLEAAGEPIEFGAGAYSVFKAMVVAITTDDGITGWGEGDRPGAVFRGPRRVMVAGLRVSQNHGCSLRPMPDRVRA